MSACPSRCSAPSAAPTPNSRRRSPTRRVSPPPAVTETLTAAERPAFVPHALVAVLLDEIAPVAGRTPAASLPLAGLARRRVRGGAPAPVPDLARQREVVEDFPTAAPESDLTSPVAVFDPDVVARSQGGGRPTR
ncbi:hypothetical protein [Streptomyces fagopyri]|uniref:hypothetical protein n=1 Tax=Streptomyces fagopyri TaxID=2662397 RepID=UPI0033CF0F05